MEASLPSTSKASPPGIEEYGPETTKLLRRILRHVEKEKENPVIPSSTDAQSRTVLYTGIHSYILEKYMYMPTTIEPENINRQLMHEALMAFYTHQKRLPTLTEFYEATKDFIPIYLDIESFREILFKMGYALHKFKECSVLYVMENKSVMFERLLYLKNIERYRKDNRTIWYVGEDLLLCYKNLLNLKESFEFSAKSDLRKRFIFAASEHSVEYIRFTDSLSESEVKKWLVEDVIPVLPPNSVMVFENCNPYCEKFSEAPTASSLKCDMVEWLQDRNIPCNVEMSKSDLVCLIENCTDTNANTHTLDNVLQAHNHDLLRLPNFLNGLSIAALVVKLLRDEFAKRKRKSPKLRSGVQNYIHVILKSINDAQLKHFSKCVIDAESKWLKHDIDVDIIMDRLVKKAKRIANIDAEDDRVVPTLSC